MKNHRLAREATGFTLIELMISIIILALAASLALPSYRQWIQNAQIRTAAESILNGMQRARAEAVARNTRVSFTLGGDDFWAIQATGENAIESNPRSTLPSTITLTPNAGLVTFNSLGTVSPNADGSTSLTQVNIDSSALTASESRDLRIAIGVGGGVRMCDPAVDASTDPRKC